VAAGAVAAILAGYPLGHAGDLIAPAALLAALGLLSALGSLLFRLRFVLAPGLLALAAEYVLVETSGRVPAVSLAGYSAGLVVLAEVLLWQRELPTPARMDVLVLVRWLQGVGLSALAAAVLAFIVLFAAGLQLPGPAWGALAGAAAGMLLLALPWLLLRGRGSRGGR
jgi:hypothetical protein